ncbi:hypothetical protein D1872_329680 [compost metagenome]
MKRRGTRVTPLRTIGLCGMVTDLPSIEACGEPMVSVILRGDVDDVTTGLLA